MIGDVNASGDTDGGGWSAPRHAYTSRDIPRTRPPKPVPIDLEALAEFNAGTAKARAAYYYDTRGEAHQPNPPRRTHRR